QNNPSPKKAVTLSGDQSSGGDSAGSTLTPAKSVKRFWRENALLHVADAGCEAFGRFILFAFALFRQGRSLEQLMDR
ncbi:hypothetical protein CKX30_04985, partial [Brucella abortus]